jgi:magnesium-transporting ATPase (P-type)
MAHHGASTVEMTNPAHHPEAPAAKAEGHKVDHAKEFRDFVEKCDKEDGLSEARAAELLVEFGPNALDEKKRSKILLFLSFLSPLNPMPCAIWIAVFIELAMAITTGEAWIDFAVLLALQFANAIVG